MKLPYIELSEEEKAFAKLSYNGPSIFNPIYDLEEYFKNLSPDLKKAIAIRFAYTCYQVELNNYSISDKSIKFVEKCIKYLNEKEKKSKACNYEILTKIKGIMSKEFFGSGVPGFFYRLIIEDFNYLLEELTYRIEVGENYQDILIEEIYRHNNS